MHSNRQFYSPALENLDFNTLLLYFGETVLAGGIGPYSSIDCAVEPLNEVDVV